MTWAWSSLAWAVTSPNYWNRRGLQEALPLWTGYSALLCQLLQGKLDRIQTGGKENLNTQLLLRGMKSLRHSRRRSGGGKKQESCQISKVGGKAESHTTCYRGRGPSQMCLLLGSLDGQIRHTDRQTNQNIYTYRYTEIQPMETQIHIYTQRSTQIYRNRQKYM